MRAADDDQDAAIFGVAAFVGLRMGELRALRWRDVDFANRLIHVQRNYTHNRLALPKSGKVRSVPLIDQTARVLDGLSRRDLFIEADGLVFCTPLGSWLNEGELRRRFYTALVGAGLGDRRKTEKPMVFHDLCHSFGTLAVQVWDLPRVQAYMGHADISTTMGYVHHIPRHSDADALTQLVNDSDRPRVEAPQAAL